MDIYEQMAVRIIQSQEEVIGDDAIKEAKKVDGLQIDWGKKTVVIAGDKKKVIEQLIECYRAMFGQPFIEVCKLTVKDLISQLPRNDIPLPLI